MQDRPLLILDLDETLVYSRKHLDDEPFNFSVGEYYVSRRPYLAEFLQVVFEWFLVAVWTSSGRDYARGVIKQLFEDPSRLVFQWYSDRCTRRFDAERQEHHWLKDLKKVRRVGYSLDRVLVLDDTPRKLQRSYGNHLRVRPFQGDPTDEELRALIPYLDWIRHQPTFRSIEKRNWRKSRVDQSNADGP